jgi:hypothetical protein
MGGSEIRKQTELEDWRSRTVLVLKIIGLRVLGFDPRTFMLNVCEVK